MDIDKAIMGAANLRRLINDLPFKAPEITAGHKREIANVMNRIAVALELTGPDMPTPEGFVRIEIPIVVNPRGGYLAMEIDAFGDDLTIGGRHREHGAAKRVAEMMSRHQEYVGAPYVGIVYVPIPKAPEVVEVRGEVEPC